GSDQGRNSLTFREKTCLTCPRPVLRSSENIGSHVDDQYSSAERIPGRTTTTMKTTKRNIATRLVGAALLALDSLSPPGCLDDEPTKPAGPGGNRQQPYSPNDGQYR